MFTERMRLAAMSTEAAYSEAIKLRNEAREKMLTARANFEDAQALVNELEHKWFAQRFAKLAG
jgi:hypothetical protein